jgi:hypothetical protein
MAKKKTSTFNIKKQPAQTIFEYFNNWIQSLNNSKIFAGLMIITLNIASKFVNIKLGKTLESYLKYSFSRQILIFAIVWMGTREIYIALLITILFIICTDFLFHEDSSFFILSNETKEHYCNLLDNPPDKVSDDDIKKAKEVLEKAKVQGKYNENSSDTSETNDLHAKIAGNSYDSFR